MDGAEAASTILENNSERVDFETLLEAGATSLAGNEEQLIGLEMAAVASNVDRKSQLEDLVSQSRVIQVKFILL